MSEFHDYYGNRVCVRWNQRARHTHAQLLIEIVDDPRENISYGFMLDDFLTFARDCADLAQLIENARAEDGGGIAAPSPSSSRSIGRPSGSVANVTAKTGGMP